MTSHAQMSCDRLVAIAGARNLQLQNGDKEQVEDGVDNRADHEKQQRAL